MKYGAKLTLSAQCTRPVKLTSFSLKAVQTVAYIYVLYVSFAKVWPSVKSNFEILADSNVVLKFDYSG